MITQRVNPPAGSKPVKSIHINTGEVTVYDSVGWAAECIHGTASSISRCCNGISNHHKGYIWSFLDDTKVSSEHVSNIRVGNKRAIAATNISSGEVFTYMSTAEAARRVYGDQSSVVKCCSGEYSQHKGYSFKYLDDKDKKFRNTGGVRRIGVHSTVEYDSMILAIRDTPKSRISHVSSCCNGRRRTHAGYKWEFITGED